VTTVDTQQAGTAPRIVILIPAYNAERHVAAVVRGAQRSGLPVVVVDDGSSDRTGAQAQAAGAIVLRHHANRGKGAALQTGFAYARTQSAEGVLTLDADGQHDTREIPSLLSAWLREPSSLVMGVRSFDPALMPRRSRVGNHISTFFISLFAGRPHRDTQTGFRIYPRRLLSLPLTTRRFDTETELLLWASKLAIPLIEVPVQTIYRVPNTDSSDAPGPSTGSSTEPETSTPRTHFRNWEDTLRVLGLVVSSPWWRRDKLNSRSDDLGSHARST
jgi:glycosyltransferase involved in cell wall biosynthesis